jgi:urease accessory protein UreE
MLEVRSEPATVQNINQAVLNQAIQYQKNNKTITLQVGTEIQVDLDTGIALIAGDCVDVHDDEYTIVGAE